MTRQLFALGGDGPWEQRLAAVVDTVRAMSTHTDPEDMVKAYAERAGDAVQADRFVALSRRDLERPHVRITRSDLWEHQPNPWKEKSKLPLLDGGLFSELIWGDEPLIINDLTTLGLRASDPAAPACARSSQSPTTIAASRSIWSCSCRRRRTATIPIRSPSTCG